MVRAIRAKWGTPTTKFDVSKANNSLFILRSGSQLLYVLVYVDDIIITGNDSQAINQFKKYILNLLQRASIDRSNGLPTPMVTTCQLSVDEGNLVEDEHYYRSIVGALQYVVITRPNIAYSVNKVFQYMHKALDLHFKFVKRILRYLQGILNYGLRFTQTSKFLLEGYSDTSWGLEVDDRRSTSGFCVFLEGNPISWSSKKHSAAVAVAGNPVMHSKFKHVELDLFFVREKVADGLFQVGHILGSNQIVDILTKPLSVFGNQNPNSKGIAKLKTVTIIINETLRFYPPLNGVVGKAVRDVQLGERALPNYLDLNIRFIALHHDPGL
ncbi:hypothetical protein EPI10_032191 [Gossypium australe]|uniref:Uncharacterized protein n=1 Tax=Gossypium australe TaxID=47621 RepID=A0A5B6X6C0_9ROSI|nr:hypothetical protein EPI10_032191 [Gossypium australe]